MKINGTIKVICVVAVLVALTSCKKEKSFPVKIVNQTNYDITNLSFSCTVSGAPLSIQSGAESETVILSYERRFRLTPKLICVSINELDNQGNNFTKILHPYVPFSYRELNESENRLVLTSTENQDTLTFSLAFQ